MTKDPMAAHRNEQQGYPGQDAADADAIDCPPMTEDELARLRPARDILPAPFFAAMEARRKVRGRPPVEQPKRQVTLRLDADVVEKFKQDGKGWQSRINDAFCKASGL